MALRALLVNRLTKLFRRYSAQPSCQLSCPLNLPSSFGTLLAFPGASHFQPWVLVFSSLLEVRKVRPAGDDSARSSQCPSAHYSLSNLPGVSKGTKPGSLYSLSLAYSRIPFPEAAPRCSLSVHVVSVLFTMVSFDVIPWLPAYSLYSLCVCLFMLTLV